LLDEPTAGMGEHETYAVANLIRRLHRNSAYTIVLIEHDMRVVFNLADKITVLGEGKMLAEGTPAEIAGNPIVQEAYLGKARPYVAAATGLDVRSCPNHVPHMFRVRGGFHGSALPLVRRVPLAQSGQGDADVRPGRRKRVPAPTLARDRRQAGLPALRQPSLL
jgi:ABC-type antimicrobial peptide transport system ATPase subunit